MNAAVRMPVLMALMMAALWFGHLGPRPARGEDVLRPLDVRQVRIGGEIGRRIDVTVNNNLLALNVEKDFLAPFRARRPAAATSAWAN